MPTFWGLLLLAPALLAEPTLDDVIEKHIAARGGRAAIDATRSLTYSTDMGGGRVRRMIKMRPNFFLVGCTDPSCAIAEGFDGAAWEMMPRLNLVYTARLEAAKALRRMGEFDHPLIGWREKGHTAVLKGVEQLRGAQVYRVDLVLNDGLAVACYLDAKTYLLTATRTPVPMHARGRHVDTLNVFEDYRPVAGVLHAHRIVTLDAATGKVLAGERGWDKIVANLPYDPAIFRAPRVVAPPLTALAQYLLSISGSVKPAEQWFRPYAAFRADRANAAVDSSAVLNWLGYELLKQDAFDDALEAFRAVAREHPESARAHESLGEALYQAGRKAEALTAFERALARDPGSAGIAAKLKELRETGELAPRY